MRILWVKAGGLWPPDTGGRLRSFHLISELSRRHRVILATTHAPGDDPGALSVHLPACERVLTFPALIPKQGSLRFLLALARSWLSRSPVDVAKFRVPGLAREVRRLCEARRELRRREGFRDARERGDLRGDAGRVAEGGEVAVSRGG